MITVFHPVQETAISSAWLYGDHQIPGGLNSYDIKGTADLVQDKCWKSFAIYIICDDQEWTVALKNAFQQWQDFLDV